nr:polyprotein [Khandagaity Melophagus ifla-like virus]
MFSNQNIKPGNGAGPQMTRESFNFEGYKRLPNRYAYYKHIFPYQRIRFCRAYSSEPNLFCLFYKNDIRLCQTLDAIRRECTETTLTWNKTFDLPRRTYYLDIKKYEREIKKHQQSYEFFHNMINYIYRFAYHLKEHNEILYISDVIDNYYKQSILANKYILCNNIVLSEVMHLLYSPILREQSHYLRDFVYHACRSQSRYTNWYKADQLIHSTVSFKNYWQILDIEDEDDLNLCEDALVNIYTDELHIGNDYDTSYITQIGRVKRRRRRLSSCEDLTKLSDHYIAHSQVLRRRDETLLRRIKNKIIALKYKYFHAFTRTEPETIPMEVLPIRIQPEMMDPEQAEQQQEAGPVILTTVSEDNVSIPTQPMSDDFWICNSTGDKIVDIKHASSMEILTQTFLWSTSMLPNSLCFKLSLPMDALQANLSSPAAMLFSQYAYWHGGMKVRMHVNTTPFCVGKLILCWYYSAQFDNNLAKRMNIASAVQLPHVFFDASIGQDCVLDIPYRNYRSMLCTRKRDGDTFHLYLGHLFCFVFNPLMSNDSSSVHGYVYLSFSDNSFTGIGPRVTIQPEMLPMKKVIKGIEKTLNFVDTVSQNLDKPSNPAVPIMYMPQPSDSFAVGINDAANIHPLRLDALGQTPHPVGSSNINSEMITNSIVRRWGFLKTLIWRTSDARNVSLMRLRVTPELSFNQYYQYTVEDANTHKYYTLSILPPISALSAINAYNRGSIEYKFEIICSKFHAGSLLISYSPAMFDVDETQATQTYSATMDIGNIKEYDFIVPYINERPYNPRFNRENSSSVIPVLVPTGELNLYVLNKLVKIGDVSDLIYINLYVRAGDDFELAVPVSPIYSVEYDHQMIIDVKPCYFKDLSSKVGVATWRYFDDLCKDGFVFKWGTGDDYIAQALGMRPFCVYRLNSFNNAKLFDKPIDCAYYSKRENLIIKSALTNFIPLYFARFIVNNDKNTYYYILPFVNLDSAKIYSDVWYNLSVANHEPYPNSPTRSQFFNLGKTSIGYICKTDSGGDIYRDVKFTRITDFEFVEVYNARPQIQNEMDNCTVLKPATNVLPSTNRGLHTFGEKFADLKDYCRRYQLYGSFVVATDPNSIATRVRIPLTPIGLDTSNKLNGPMNYMWREGLIGYIASAFRYYRGGMRFKFVITQVSDNNKQIVYLQHKPDLMHKDRNIELKHLTDVNDISDYLQSGYAYTMMSLDVNNCITIEVPCYIPTNLLMLQKPNFVAQSEIIHYSLGVIDVIFPVYRSGKIMKYIIDIHYALADDMEFSVFVGFPPMIPLYKSNAISIHEESFEHIQPEMADENQEPVATTSTQSEGALDYISRPFRNTKDWLYQKYDSFTKASVRASLNLEPSITPNEDTIGKIIKDALLKFGSEYYDVIVSIVSQIAHCINHPQVSTFVIAMSTILCHFGMQCYHYVADFCRWFGTLFARTENNTNGNNAVRPEAEDNKTETSSMEKAKISITTKILELGASLYGKSVNGISAFAHMIPTFSKGIFNEIRLGSLTVIAVITLFRNLVDVVPKMLSWIGQKLNPLNWLRWFMYDSNDFIMKWIKDVEYVTDPNVLDKVKSQSRYVYHVELLVMVGRDLMNKSSKLAGFNHRYVQELCKRLNDVYTSVIAANMAAGSIGIEPFCYCIYGDSQIGKTYLTKQIAAACLKRVGYTTYSELFYTRPITTKHWDGVQRQPVLIYDDFLHNRMDDYFCETVSELLLLKSKATFTPPRADVVDKGKKYSPLIVCMTMNENPYYEHNKLADNTAWQNRRDYVIRQILHVPEQYKYCKRYQDLPAHLTHNNMHVRYQIHEYTANYTGLDMNKLKFVSVPKVNVNGELILVDGNYVMEPVSTLTYTQLEWFLSECFVEKYAHMRDEYLKDLQLVQSFYPSVDADFSVNIENYRKHIATTVKYFNAREQQTLTRVNQITHNLDCHVCNKNPAECLCHIEIFDVSTVGSFSEIVQPEMPNGSPFGKYFPTIMDVAVPNNITQLQQSLSIDYLKVDLLEQYPWMSEYELELFIAEYTKYVINNTFPERFKYLTLNNKWCEHQFINYFKTIGYSVEVDDCESLDDQLIFFNRNHEFKAHTHDCVTNCGLYNSSEYRDIIYKFILLNHPDCKIPTPFVPVDPVKKQIGERYVKRIAKMKQEFLDELSKTISPETWLGKIWNCLKNILKPIAYIVGAFASVWAIVKVTDFVSDCIGAKYNQMKLKKQVNISFAKQLETHEISEECLAGGCALCRSPEMAYDNKRIIATKKNVVVHPKPVAEMALEMQYSIDNSLKRNYFFYTASNNNGLNLMSRCLGLRGRWFIAIDHYFEKYRVLPADTIFEIAMPNARLQCHLTELEIHKLKNSALCICRLPIRFPAFKDITKYFIRADMVPNVHTDANLYIANLRGSREIISSFDVSWIKQHIALHQDRMNVPNINDYEGGKPTSVDMYWSYQTSGPGLCGSILISDMNIHSPLIGIHIAGNVNGGRGYAEVICRETLVQFLDKMDPLIEVKDIEIEGQMFNGQVIKFDTQTQRKYNMFEGNFNFIGFVPSQFAFRQSQKSSNKHSLCYNQITQSTYDVPHISSNDPRFPGENPMINGCVHHGNPPLSFKKKMLDLVYQDICDFILTKVKPCRVVIGKLSINEAICGIPDIPNYDALEFGTSEGFPFSAFRPPGYSDKKWLFDLSLTQDGYIVNAIDANLYNIMEYKEELRDNLIVPCTIFTDCLKDQKLPVEKCYKTRIFSISPADFTIQFRQYFYDFTIAFQNARFNVESAIGIDCDSLEWNEMIRLLLENSEDFVCGDYSKFGPRLMADCVWLAFQIIIEWYIYFGDKSEYNKRQRFIMGYELTFAKHLMYNIVYEVFCGAPSGSPITTIINTIVNMFYIRVAFYYIISNNLSQLSITKQLKYMFGVLTLYYSTVKVIFYGDDLIMTVSGDILPFFNATSLSFFFKKYNIKFTDALKTGTMQLSSKIFDEETSFLKRTTVRHPFRPFYISRMDKRAIEETCNWIYNKLDPVEASVVSCESMFLNAFGMGPRYYNDLRSRTIQWWRNNYQRLPLIPLWQDVDIRIFGDD